MKKIHLGLIGIATLFLTACTVGVSSNQNSVIKDTDSITNLTVTFDFNGGTYDSQTTVAFDNVKPTSYWKYVRARLDEEKIISPEHTTFKGFSSAQDDPKIIDDSYVIKEDITVYAQYEAKEGEYCTVNWKDGETSKIIKTETYFEGEKPELKDIPYHDGKTFDHWEPVIHAVTQEEITKGSIEYTAIYVPIKIMYTVTLNYDDGSEQPIHTQTVLNGKCAVKPEVTKEGYELKNWTYVDGGEGEFDFSTPITKNGIKIEANWIKVEPFLQSVTMSVTITEPTTISFSCDKDDKYMVEWGDGALDIENHHDYQSGTHLIKIFGSGELKSFKMTNGQSCLSEVNIANVESLAEYAFEGCSNLKTVTFGEESQLKSISSYAFENCSSLTSITIPSSVTSIGNDAFYICSQLKTVTFEEGSQLTSIGLNTFSGCQDLIFNIDDDCRYLGSVDNQYLALIYGKDKNVVINGNCRVISDAALSNCSSLTNITIPSSVTSIGNYAFIGCSQLQTVTFEEESKLTSIGSKAFEGCSKLQTVTFAGESKLTSISNSAFRDCSSLTSITIPSGVTSISNSAFEGCSKLQTVTFAGESKLTSIDGSAFYDCSSLTSITIPSGVTSIGDFAFDSCSKLQTVDLTAVKTVPSLGWRAFYDCPSELKFHVASQEMKDKFVEQGWPEAQIVIGK